MFVSYVLVCTYLYITQEDHLFQFTPLSKNHVYKFPYPFEEVYLPIESGKDSINALHFKVQDTLSNGVVLFFHGNGGTLQGWGHQAELFLNNNYDVFFVEYRNFGKSGGDIAHPDDLIDDGELAYQYLLKSYSSDQIIFSGTSMGTGVASQLAKRKKPKMLILNAPYSGLNKLIKEKMFFLPEIVIKYKYKTYKVLPSLQCPVHIFHGTSDNLIPIHHSQELSSLGKHIQLYKIKDADHINFDQKPSYKKLISKILTES